MLMRRDRQEDRPEDERWRAKNRAPLRLTLTWTLTLFETLLARRRREAEGGQKPRSQQFSPDVYLHLNQRERGEERVDSKKYFLLHWHKYPVKIGTVHNANTALTCFQTVSILFSA